MSTTKNFITLDEIIARYDEVGNVFEVDTERAVDLRTKNSKSIFDVTYMPLQFKLTSGKTIPFNIKLTNQPTASGAKAPKGSVSEGKWPKAVQINFSKLTEEDLSGDFYSPTEKATDTETITEELRASNFIKTCLLNNDKWLKVLEIIDISFQKACAKLIEDSAKFPFKLNKNPKVKEIPIGSIKQSSMINEETKEQEEFQNPIYRVKIPVNVNNGEIGIFNNTTKQFKPVVFDQTKSNKQNNFQPVAAKVIIGKNKDNSFKYENLNVNNVGQCITRLSLTGGYLKFDSIVSSKTGGLSLSNNYNELYVKKYKRQSSKPAFTASDILEMNAGLENDTANNEELEYENNLAEKNNNKSNEDDDEDEDDDSGDDAKEENDPVDSDEEETDEPEPVVEVAVVKKTVRQTKAKTNK